MAITSELVIARHGEAVCNVEGTVGGDRGCTGLTDRGRDQARRLARRLAAEHALDPFDTFYASPRLRVRQTAEEIAAGLRITLNVEAGLRGPDYGECDGGSWREVRSAFGGNPRRYPDHPFARGSETWNEYLSRAGAVIRDILARHAGRRTLIVAHRETVEAAHTLLLGLRPDSSMHLGFVTGHASLTRWQRHVDRYGQRTWRLATHNDGSHLDGQPATDMRRLPGDNVAHGFRCGASKTGGGDDGSDAGRRGRSAAGCHKT